jgi:hypothetical protein
MGRRGERPRRSEVRGQRSEAVDQRFLRTSSRSVDFQGCGVSVSAAAAFTVFPLTRTASSIFFSLVASGS